VYTPKTCRAKNTSIKLPCCIKLAFHIILLLKLLMSILLLSQKMLNDKVKIILQLMIIIVLAIILILWNKFLINFTQVWNVKKKWANYKIPQNKTLIWVWRDIHKDPERNCPFISSPLNYICNKILLWGVSPDGSKYAVIKNHYIRMVTGVRCLNYRPVSL